MAGLSVNEITTYRWTFDQDVARYRAAGIEAIGVWRQKLADYGEERGIELLRESGLNVSNLLWAGGFTGSDGHSYEESIEDAREAIRLARLLSDRFPETIAHALFPRRTNYPYYPVIGVMSGTAEKVDDLGLRIIGLPIGYQMTSLIAAIQAV